MTTKITVLGSEATEKKELKKIEFKGYLMSSSLEINEAILDRDEPCKLNEIILLPKPVGHRYDLFLCVRIDGSQFYMLGHFNDGVV